MDVQKAIKVGVGAVIVDRKTDFDKILMIKRGNEPWKGMWSIPGGKVHFGEQMLDALKREILEETNLHIETINHLCTFDEIVKDSGRNAAFHFVFIDYLAYPVGGELKASSDVTEAKWMTIDQIYRLFETGSVPSASITPLRSLSKSKV